ncbi:PREDICTED: leucine-rich repeat-containing G-protein coupled receptor 5-like isoform X2 [Acropora digitifera]|uniref:leucine-rich repeat-containing G-protein coupled receptor 5-like isoform X2 n=1 Tax=Acropora digitifera TaxID=70779 RepID=UPI00077B0002|nr:PREDICTED: leucine-rich repeat-containing G-protein coupled receptor 5-like isoform X2 [Acropora digitifera]
MSWLWRFQAVTFCCLIYGINSFLGYEYWKRYALNYPSDWTGFRRAYYGRYRLCSGCSCSDIDRKVTCSGTPSSLTIRYKIIKTLSQEDLLAANDSLTSIEIYNSGLESILNAFHPLTKLKTLKLAQNQLKDFPDISKNVALQELNLISNKIDWIPDSWFDLPNLEYIGLSYNNLKRFPGSSFVNCKSLIYLGIDANQISFLSVTNLKPFYGNGSKLVHLNVGKNAISSISTGAFSGLIHLKVLELQENNINSIAAKVFHDMPELRHL